MEHRIGSPQRTQLLGLFGIAAHHDAGDAAALGKAPGGALVGAGRTRQGHPAWRRCVRLQRLRRWQTGYEGIQQGIEMGRMGRHGHQSTQVPGGLFM